MSGIIEERDENGNLIHYKGFIDYESWWEYNEKGEQVYYRNSGGHEHWKEYDKKGVLVCFRYKYPNGEELYYAYVDKEAKKITKQEFEKIKKRLDEEFLEILEVSRFELMEI